MIIPLIMILELKSTFLSKVSQIKQVYYMQLPVSTAVIISLQLNNKIMQYYNYKKIALNIQ